MNEPEERPANIPYMTVTEAVERLAGLFVGAVRGGLPFAALPAVMLWGPPGVGKSRAACQVGDRIAAETGRSAVVTDVRLLMFNPIDLRGIPVANEDKTLAVWLKPAIFQMDERPDTVNILLLDEISAAPQSVQAAAYQIALDRRVGEFALPDNTIVIAAGNRVTDRSVAYRMPKALANRLLHVEVRPDCDSWLEWAARSGIHPAVMGFLSARPDMLMRFDPAEDSPAFPTPRSWEMCSNVLHGVSAGGSGAGKAADGGVRSDIDAAFSLLAGLVGEAAAVEFKTWARVFESLPSMDAVFSGRAVAVPKGADALYALVCAMGAYAAEHRDDLDAIGRSLAYARKLPPDFCIVLLRDYLAIEPGFQARLAQVPEFMQLVRSKGAVLNGIA